MSTLTPYHGALNVERKAVPIAPVFTDQHEASFTI